MKRRPPLRRRPESRGQGMDTAPNHDITDPYVPKCTIQLGIAAIDAAKGLGSSSWSSMPGADVSQNHYGLAKAAQDDEKTTVAPAEAGVQGSGHGYCRKPRYRRPLRSQMLHPTGNRLWTPPVMCGNRCVAINRSPIILTPGSPIGVGDDGFGGRLSIVAPAQDRGAKTAKTLGPQQGTAATT